MRGTGSAIKGFGGETILPPNAYEKYDTIAGIARILTKKDGYDTRSKSDKDNLMIEEFKLTRTTLGPGESGSRVFFYGETTCLTKRAILNSVQDHCLSIPEIRRIHAEMNSA